MTYVIRPAVKADLPAMISLRGEAERWLAAAGVRQWTPEYAEYGRCALADVVARGVAWVVTDDSRVAATVSIADAEISDRAFWGRVAVDVDDALYVGKMIVSRAHAGRELGSRILDWATKRAQQAGKRWLRIDVRRDNTRLHQYYLERGFTHVATVLPLPGQRTESGWLAQRPGSGEEASVTAGDGA